MLYNAAIIPFILKPTIVSRITSITLTGINGSTAIKKAPYKVLPVIIPNHNIPKRKLKAIPKVKQQANQTLLLLLPAIPAIYAKKGKDRMKPPVKPNITPKPPKKPAKTGTPIPPRRI